MAIVTPARGNCYLPGSTPWRFGTGKTGSLKQRLDQFDQFWPRRAPAGRHATEIQISNSAGGSNGRQIQLTVTQGTVGGVPFQHIKAASDFFPLAEQFGF